jgi:hypothetical protein
MMGESILCPRLDQDVEGLEEPVATFAVRDVEALIVPGKAAASHAELQPALGNVVDRGDILSQA